MTGAPDHVEITHSPPLAPGDGADSEPEGRPVLKRVMRLKTMPDILKPLPEWTDEELAERARTYPRGDPLLGDKLTAEIDRRRVGSTFRYKFGGFLFAALVAFGIAAITSVIVAFHLTP